MSLIDVAQQALGQSGVARVSQQLGIPPGLAQTAIAAALPMLVNGMARHASQPAGADAIQQATDAHDGVLANVPNVLNAGPPADQSAQGGLLGRILGSHQQTVHDGVQQASGLNEDQVGKLLMMVAPIALGVLAHQRKQQMSQNPQGGPDLSATLQQEATAAQQQSPQLGGLLRQIMGR
ncbi:MAG: DUF937 domain-containing protein [Gemmatimonadota bacterium]|nr:DUF937 domain-containing protein [Gemmatimonadota bacterium]